MPSMCCGFTAYTFDQEKSYILMDVSINMCCICVPVIEYIAIACCADIFDIWPLYIWPNWSFKS